ncbi:MAG: response regulator [Candidatus Margulisbacteria bacterium]|nr:response regulator [Candidatus Margulisiibacteriota bacterium]
MSAKKLVMVVEDNGELADHVTNILLKTKKYDVINAYDGQQALELYQLHKRFLGIGESKIKAIILDIKMQGMDGLEFLRRMRYDEKTKPKIPVVILSAYEDKDKWMTATHSEYGAVCSYLKKPFNRNELLDTLERIFKGESQRMIAETVEKCYEKLEGFLSDEINKSEKDKDASASASEHFTGTEESVVPAKPRKLRVMIGTLYNYRGILANVNNYSVNKIFLILPEIMDSHSSKSLATFKNSLSPDVEIVTKSSIKYKDMIEISREVARIIDNLPKETVVFIDISSGDKLITLGILFGAYARAERIKYILYLPEKSNKVICLPKVEYEINDAQKNLLKAIIKKPGITTLELVKNQSISQGLIYKYIRKFLEINALNKENEQLFITDLGHLLLI